jgi:uncharacterized membrane protein
MSPSQLPSSAQKNIEVISRLELHLLGRRSLVERLGDGIARFFGSLAFVVAINVAQPQGKAFDPYPFPLVGLIIGVEFILLTTFVLMNQNVQSRRQEKWGHLTLQVCLLSEQESTKCMQMLHLICQHLGLDQPSYDPESNELAQATPLPTLVEEIEKSRDANGCQ